MSENLCPKVNMGNEDWDPDVITRMIILGPGARVSESEIVGEFHMLGLPLTIKNTCYGSMISGKKDDVLKAIEEIILIFLTISKPSKSAVGFASAKPFC